MIIQFSDDEKNKRAIEALKAEQHHEIYDFFDLGKTDQSDNTLILLDLSADGTTQGLIEPSILAEELNDRAFLNHVKIIKLLISDIDPNMPMHVYASELCASILNLKPESSIPIMYIGENDDIMSLIEPPTPSQQSWIVHSLPFDRVKFAAAPKDKIEDTIKQYKDDIDNQKNHFEFFKRKMTSLSFKGDNKALWAMSQIIQPDAIRKEFRHP